MYSVTRNTWNSTSVLIISVCLISYLLAISNILARFLYSITREGKEQSVPNFIYVELISKQATVPKMVKFDFYIIASALTLTCSCMDYTRNGIQTAYGIMSHIESVILHNSHCCLKERNYLHTGCPMCRLLRLCHDGRHFKFLVQFI